MATHTHAMIDESVEKLHDIAVQIGVFDTEKSMVSTL
jgi:hypothetical protein